MGDELDLCVRSDWVSHLDSAYWHAVTDSVISKVHIMVEQAGQFWTDKEIFTLDVTQNVPPDDL